MMKTIVVGSGIIGASVAYHLVSRGAEVTVVPGDSSGGIATRASFAWINAAPGNSRSYFEFRLKAMLDWHRLQRELGDLLQINWNGSLWWEDEMKAVKESVRLLVSWGYPMRVISKADARKQEPFLSSYPNQSVYSAMEGSLPPLRTAQLLLDRAASRGVTIHAGTVLALTTEKGRATGVKTSSGNIKADKIILAAGIATEVLCNEVGVTLPMTNQPGFIVWSNPRPQILRGVLLSPRMHMRQCVDGRIVAGWDFDGGVLPVNLHHEAQKLINEVREMLMDDDLYAECFSQGVRPIPSDGLPIIGPVPNLPGLYLLIMHSGITLAPLVGRLSAEEIMEGCSLDILERYRLDRFIANSC